MNILASPISPATQATIVPNDAPLEGLVKLSHLGVIQAEGADAGTFLQGQLTQDVLGMAAGESRLAAFCSAKGRMQASFHVLKRNDTDYLLVCSLDILPATLKRMAMFVLRAKARLSDASSELSILGLAGTAIQSVSNYHYSTGASAQISQIEMISLPPVNGIECAIGILPQGQPLPPATQLPLDVWRWAEVRSGVATITGPIVDAFVPQMLNFESVGGVNFKKGCYPGQEVVARSQFRGTLKRRAYLVSSDEAMAAGDFIFSALDPGQACGTVAQAAPRPAQQPEPGRGFEAIASMQVAAAIAGHLTINSATGPAIEILALPYRLLDDI